MDIGKGIWRQIPPEEKFDLIARSQSKGLFASIILILIACTFAMALKIQGIIWLGFLASPFIFRMAANRAWRGVKGRLMLEYLAARTVARRFGYITKATELGVQLLFRANIKQQFESETDTLSAAFQAIEDATLQTDMWIGLLDSAVVGFAEGRKGADATFIAKIDDKVTLQGRNLDDSESEYSNNRELLISIKSEDHNTRTYKITSHHPAALVAFEQKFQGLQAKFIQKRDAVKKIIEEPVEDEY